MNLQRSLASGPIIYLNFSLNQLKSTVLNIFCFIKVIGDWNNQPTNIVETGSLELFELRQIILKFFLGEIFFSKLPF